MSKPPVADVRPRYSAAHRYFGGSTLWLLTLLCLLVASGLIWWSLPPRGTAITIQFPAGHGLKPEDTVRYRGIEVGTVETVELDDSLEQVEVEVLLKPSATQLASEGTRFWIVRPELGLTRISGLETAIGHKYIGVSPGPEKEASQASYYFQGLADVPVDTFSDPGVELTLRGDKRYSVSKGSNVTFRGVDVGTVLDVTLSKEARHVDLRVRIFEQYADLLTEQTKFWATAGLDLDFKFGFGGGFNLDTESLETLARGGVSMITTGQGKPVSPGDVFTLHATAEKEWFAKAAKFEATSVPLKGAVPIKGSWQRSGFFGSKSLATTQCNGVAVLSGGGPLVLFPAGVFESVSTEESFALSAEGAEISGLNLSGDGAKNGLLSLAANGNFKLQTKPFDLQSDVASEAQPMACLAVRRGDDPNAFFHLAIKADSLREDADDPNRWTLIDFNGDRKVWHGSPVVSASDGKLVGILLIERRRTQILKVSGFGS